MSRTVQLQKGENLSKLANRHGLSSSAEIYYADCNVALRRNRPNPSKVKEGDLVIVPSNNIELLDERLLKLLKLKGDMQEFYAGLESEIKDGYRDINQKRLVIDTIADLLLLKVGLVKLLYKPTASAIEVALVEKEALKSTLTMVVDIPYHFYKKAAANESGDLDYGKVKEDRNKEVISLLKKKGINLPGELISSGSIKQAVKKLGGTALDFVGDALSILHPTFWAEKWTGVNPEKITQENINNIQRARNANMKNLDSKIMNLYEAKMRYNRMAMYMKANLSLS